MQVHQNSDSAKKKRKGTERKTKHTMHVSEEKNSTYQDQHPQLEHTPLRSTVIIFNYPQASMSCWSRISNSNSCAIFTNVKKKDASCYGSLHNVKKSC